MENRLNWLPALAFFMFGCVFLFAAFQIQSFGGGNGSRIMPIATSALVLILSALLLVLHFREQDLSGDSDIVAGEFLLYSGPLIALMAIYAVFHTWFGYLSATFVCGIAAFKLFGNSWLASLIHAVAGTAILYFTFVSLLNVYDPPGRVFDVNSFFSGR